MPRGDVVEVFGRLNHRDENWTLRPDGGGEWRLDLGWKRQGPFVALLGLRARLVGVRDGYDLLAVRSVEAADRPTRA